MNKWARYIRDLTVQLWAMPFVDEVLCASQTKLR